VEAGGDDDDGDGSGGEVGALDALAAIRARLDVLVANVGLDDAQVLVCEATAAEDDYAPAVRDVCTRLGQRLIGDGELELGVDGLVRYGVLATVGAPRKVTLVMVGEHGKLAFDRELARELLDAAGWRVRRYVSVFPDLDGWRIRDLDDYTFNTPGFEEEDLAFRTDADGEVGERVTIQEALEAQQREEARRKEAAAEAAAGRGEYEYADAVVGSWKDDGEDDAAASLKPGPVVGAAGLPDADETAAGGAEAAWESVDAEVVGGGAEAPPAAIAEDGLVGEARFAHARSQADLKEPVGLKEAIQASMDEHGPSASAAGTQLNMRVLHGSGAFANLERKMRQMCAKTDGSEMRVFVVSGWNEARVHPFIMEMDAGMQAGRVALQVGLNIFGASATLAKVGAGVTAARAFRADIVVAFGGGAVMDAAKAVASLLPLDSDSVALALARIRGAAESERAMCTLNFPEPAFPVVLIAGTVGSGAEVSDQAILNATVRNDGSVRRIAVFFENAAMRMAVADPRLVLPRRASSRDVAMGGLQALCFAIDVLLCPDAPKQAVNLAERAIVRGRDAILQARREPESSDGPARDSLVDLAMFAALAREACGGLGVATTLSLALLDTAAATTCGLDAPLRTVLPRVTAALANEVTILNGRDAAKPCPAANVVLGRENATGKELCHFLLSLAEDIGVPLVDFVGVSVKGLERAVATVMRGGLVTPCGDPRLLTADALSHVVFETTEQQFEL
jgi:alcohol dehydrogenase class IV